MTKAELNFDNSYSLLPGEFFSALDPTPVSSPGPIRVNYPLAKFLGIDPHWLASAEGTEVIAGNRVLPGSRPIASVYAGHQFGSWNPQLGDGRAILLGELIAGDGQRFDIQLKGAGPTPYSRGGDGRSPLGPVLREYLVSEAIAALGIPTTRALAAVTTGDTVIRDEMLPGAILARVARSHIRIGTVQFFASRGERDALRLLVDHVIERHYPDAGRAQQPVRALLDEIIKAQASLIAHWQLVGFIHGVMNTDNMLLSGETIDYGPCAFMDRFDPDTVYSSIDRGGRYAYRNQPGIAHWNLAALAQALLPLLGEDKDAAVASAQEAVDAFPALFMTAHQEGALRKLGLGDQCEGDEELFQRLLTVMSEEEMDFTLTFRGLSDLANPEVSPEKTVQELITLPQSFQDWLTDWRERCSGESRSPSERQAGMYTANPAYIPRNHLVEAAIRAATLEGNFDPFHRLVERLAKPFEYDSADQDLALPPRPEQEVRQTFCGT